MPISDGRGELIGLELALWSPCNVTTRLSFKALRVFPVSLAYKSPKCEKIAFGLFNGPDLQ
jgi:hypothetical protein